MKFTRLAAALGLAAVSTVPAFASIGRERTTSVELFVVVFDDAVGSYSQDLGIDLTTFRAAANTPGYSFSFPVGPVYSQYTAVDTNLNDGTPFEGTRWALLAVDTDSLGIPGESTGYRYLTTLNQQRNPTPPEISNDSLSQGTGVLGVGYVENVNQTAAHPVTISFNDETFNPVGTPAAFTETGSSSFNASSNLLVGNPIGTSSPLVEYYTSDYDLTLNATHDQFAGRANFDGATFTYSVSAVPEPATYALMLAGLAAVGFVARRR